MWLLWFGRYVGRCCIIRLDVESVGENGMRGMNESEAMECIVSLSLDIVRSRKSNMVKNMVLSLLKKW